MPARRKAAAVATVGLAPLALTAPATAPAVAHGSMGDPVSRVSQCYAEGPESPRSDACRAAVAAGGTPSGGGTQALYDWNGIRIGDANGRHQELIPDGRLCSANNEEFRGLDLARADWPATSVRSGSYTFKYRVTAPHKGTFTVYLTKPGYDPAQPLAWDDLDLSKPVATATDPVASGGFYTFSGTLPERSGKHLLFADWQRSDAHSVGVFLNGDAIAEPDARGRRVVDDSFLLLLNGYWEPVDFRLPDPTYGDRWTTLLDTAEPQGTDESEHKADTEMPVQARSLVLLSRPSRGGG